MPYGSVQAGLMFLAGLPWTARDGMELQPGGSDGELDRWKRTMTGRGTIASEQNEELVMGDPGAPERPGGRDAVAQEQAGTPPMPVIWPSEQDADVPYALLYQSGPMVGWQFRPQAKGGPAFVIVRRGGFTDSLKVVETFPLTEDGWASSWQRLVALNPAAVPEVLARLEARDSHGARRQAQQELDARSLVSLSEMGYLGGYVPGAAITPGGWYDVRFLEDRLAVVACGQAEVLAEVPYSEVEDVEIGGPGLVTRVGPRFGSARFGSPLTRGFVSGGG